MVVKRALMRPAFKTLAWALGIIVLLLLTVFTGSFFIDKPLRGYMEKTVNRHLKGYTATLRGAHFQPLDFALTLKGVTIIQDANPSPPVADLPVFKASLNWRSLIHGRVVGELYLDRPRLHVDLTQLRHEKARKFPVKQEGWQRAFEAIYPLKINRIVIEDGDITYIDADPQRPLHIAGLNALGENIRNIVSPDKPYPTPLHLDGVIFEKGRLAVDGSANFDLKFAVDDAELRPMNDILLAYGNFDVEGGKFSMFADVHIKDGRISGYIKPFFKDIDVYDKRKEKDRSLFHKLYVRIIGLVATILENPGQDTVATKITISGTVEKPKTSTWQVIKNLIKHAFFHAFLPEFDKAVSKKSPQAGKTSQDKSGGPEKPADGSRPPP